MKSETCDLYNQPLEQNLFMKENWFLLMMGLLWMIKFQTSILPFEIQ